jgi:hypothetical protein
MISIYKENDKTLSFARTNINGATIRTRPQGLWFTVRDKKNRTVLSKSMDNGITQKDDGSWEIYISSLDTVNLEPDDYFCDVKVKNESGKEYTIVKPQTFKIMKVATERENQEG